MGVYRFIQNIWGALFSRNSIVTIDEENQKRCVVRRFEPCWQCLHLDKTVGLGYNIIRKHYDKN